MFTVYVYVCRAQNECVQWLENPNEPFKFNFRRDSVRFQSIRNEFRFEFVNLAPLHLKWVLSQLGSVTSSSTTEISMLMTTQHSATAAWSGSNRRQCVRASRYSACEWTRLTHYASLSNSLLFTSELKNKLLSARSGTLIALWICLCFCCAEWKHNNFLICINKWNKNPKRQQSTNCLNNSSREMWPARLNRKFNEITIESVRKRKLLHAIEMGIN